MKIFLTGKNGQLGHRLEKDLKQIHEVIATDRDSLDLLDTQLIKDRVYQAKPDLIVNAAAYTNVDQAEKEKDLAYKINALAPEALSQAAKALDIPIIHISTDYVFDGTKERAYLEDDQVNPLSVYGMTKWQGEEFVRQAPKHFILRTSWLFSTRGPSFLNTMLKLAKEKYTINMVNDQWGTPTSTKTLVKVIQEIITRLSYQNLPEIYGTYHVTSNGKTNWYDYSIKILSIFESSKIKILLKKNKVIPISCKDYSQKACRPLYSVLETKKYRNMFLSEFPDWDKEVENIMQELG